MSLPGTGRNFLPVQSTTGGDYASQFKTEAKPLYEGALSRFTQQQRTMRADFQGAESPLTTARTLYEKGGEYGEGQRSLIREEGQKTQSNILANMVGSGMASGSNIAGATAAVNRGMTTQMLQVEDVRTERLSDILKSLSALRTQAAGVMGTTREPDYSSYLGGYSAGQGYDAGIQRAGMGSYSGGSSPSGMSGPNAAGSSWPTAASSICRGPKAKR